MRIGKNRYYKELFMAVLLAFFCFTITSCGFGGGSGSVAVQPGEPSSDDAEEEEKEYGEETKIHIYTMDPDSLEAEEVEVKVDTTDGLTPQVIVDAVLDSFEAQGQDIGVNLVEQQDNTVIVDFKGGMAPVSSVGSAEETAILDCLSMSLLDNLDDCHQVVFHVDGEHYESGHYVFELNEAYKWKN